jgi:hypothetical protein
MADLTVITNHVPRFILDAYELSADERMEFDYLDWKAIERGEESASFFRYRGELYDLGEFTVFDYPYFFRSPDDWRSNWDGIQTDSFFSATVIRYVDDYESVIVGRVYS